MTNREDKYDETDFRVRFYRISNRTNVESRKKIFAKLHVGVQTIDARFRNLIITLQMVIQVDLQLIQASSASDIKC